MELHRRRKWHSTSRPQIHGRDQKTEAVLCGVDSGVRGLYVAANRAVRGILVKVAFSCKMEQKGTKADQNQTRNRK